MKNHFRVYALILIVGLLSSCSPKDPTIELKAIVASPEQTAAPFTEVTLDGSQSTGPEGFRYEWIYTGNETVNLSSTTDAVVTFTPEKNIRYDFTLRVTNNGNFNETIASVTVTGAVVLDASFFTTEDVQIYNAADLIDVEADPNLPDYIINNDFTIPDGIQLNVLNGDMVTIAIADGAGIIVKGGIQNHSTALTLQPSGSNWKGILVDGGYLAGIGQYFIKNAGGAAFNGHTAAAIVVTNNGNIYYRGEINDNAADYGIIITPTAALSPNLSLSTSGVKYPIKIDMTHYFSTETSTEWNSISDFNLTSDDYEYIHFTTDGAGTIFSSGKPNMYFKNYKFYIDGDFTAADAVIARDAIIYMKEGAGIVAGGFSFDGTTIKGLNDANWKGIASAGNIELTNSTITGAGSAIHNTGTFTSLEKAAIYGTGYVRTKDSAISNSGGYGVYINSSDLTNDIAATTFSDIVESDVSIPHDIVYGTINTDNTWSGNLPVEIRSGSTGAGGEWPSLGTGNAYLITTNININSGYLKLSPGAHLKFQTGKSLTVSSRIIANGTANEPIIIDGVDGTPGSWNGMLLLGEYQMSNCIITNGGGAAFIGAQAAANVTFSSNASSLVYPQNLYSFENNTISNSADFGTTILLGKYDPVTLAGTNTFTSNANGDIKLP